MSNAHHADGSKSAKSNKSILWGLLGLAFLSWGVYLAGLALVQNQCYDSDNGALNTVAPQFQSVNIIPYPNSCRDQFGFHWWILFFELFVLVLITACLTGLARADYWHASWFFLAIVTTLLMIQIDNWLGVYRNGALYNTLSLGRVRTVLSGLFLLTILNSLIAFFMPSHGRPSLHGKGMGEDREIPGKVPAYNTGYNTTGRAQQMDATAV